MTAHAPVRHDSTAIGSAPSMHESASTAIIALVSTAFGVLLVQGAALVGDIVAIEDPGTNGVAGLAATVIAWIFIGIGAYSAAVVTANTFTTIVAGRLRPIARLRLLGATAASLRRRLALVGGLAGSMGAVVGLALGIAGARLAVLIGVGAGALPATDTPWFSPAAVVPALVAIATVGAAAWIGTAPVSRVSPVLALSSHVEPLAGARAPRRGRLVTTWLTLGVGTVLLGVGVVLGLEGPMGLPVAFLGGVLHASGVIVGAPFTVPWLVDLVARSGGSSPSMRLARAEAARSPERTARATIGMVLGVGLVVMFVVALATMRSIVLLRPAPGDDAATIAANTAQIDLIVLVATAVMVGLAAVSALLAAIGMVATAELRVVQRRQELGLLRAVGATSGQVRRMVALESCLESVVAVGLGTAIGILYGWAGAHAAFAGYVDAVIPPSVPVALVVGVVVIAAVVGIAASILPARRATRSTPIEALATA